MTIKRKLIVGTGVLFSLLLIVSIVSIGSLYYLKQHTAAIVQANHNSIEYMHRLLQNLENNSAASTREIEHYLHKQSLNITEAGEYEATQQLLQDYKNLRINKENNTLAVKNDIYRILSINMKAIEQKSLYAQSRTFSASIWIMGTTALCVLLAFTLAVNIPLAMTNPIQAITNIITQFTKNDYKQRIIYNNNDEFRVMIDAFNSMAEKLDEYTTSILNDVVIEKKRVESLIENFHDPIIGFDHHMNTVFVNKEFLKISGTNSEQILGVNAHTLAKTNNLVSTLVRDIEQSSGQEKSTIFHHTLTVSYDGKEIYYDKEIIPLSLVPVGETSDVEAGYVCILRNVTTYKELDIAKTQLIATLSHEFKTPIASIRMSLQLLENIRIGDLNAQQRELLHSIDDDTRRLLHLIGEILTMSQVESGHIHLSMYPSSVRDIIDYAMSAVSSQARQKQIQYDVHYPHEEVPLVMVDSEKTAWVFVNLLSNALRYSHESSSITIDVQYNDKHVSVAVTDRGHGIPAEYLPRLFDRYFKVPGTSREGNGLGLSISKDFIEAQSGTISVQSEVGVGTTFTVYLCPA